MRGCYGGDICSFTGPDKLCVLSCAKPIFWKRGDLDSPWIISWRWEWFIYEDVMTKVQVHVLSSFSKTKVLHLCWECGEDDVRYFAKFVIESEVISVFIEGFISTSRVCSVWCGEPTCLHFSSSIIKLVFNDSLYQTIVCLFKRL